MTQIEPAGHPTVSSVSAWVLRAGVVCSSLVMLIGILFTFAHGTMSVQRMTSDGFDYRLGVIFDGIRHGQGKRIIEAGIYLLVLTPIMRVFASCVIFVFQDRDRVYGAITLGVLVLTLAGLIWLG